jgi:predicted MPP superfamily phosphohydrolase
VTRRRRLALLLSLGALAPGLLALWAFVREPASLQVRRHELVLPGWPADHRPLTVALLADLHTGAPWQGLDTLAAIVETTNALRPDLVLLAGDFVIHGVLGGDFVPPEESAPVLGRLAAPLGVYAVLGNHDHWLDAARVGAALQAAGIPVLEDQALRIEREGGAFWLVGLKDCWERDCDPARALAQLTDGSPVLAFTHNPDLFATLPDRFALVMAGHTHGGQVALPLFGRLIVPSRYGQRYAHGLVVEQGRQLFVTTGIGTSILPVRFGVPPEIALLTLRPVEPAP